MGATPENPVGTAAAGTPARPTAGRWLARHRRRVLAAALGPLAGASAVLVDSWIVSAYGVPSLIVLRFFLKTALILSLPVAALLGVLALLALPFRRWRARAAGIAMAATLWIVSVVAGLFLSESARMHGFARLAERSRPLVAAIQTYAERHGRPPASLGDLVPGLLPAVPSTGMGTYPEYEYLVGDDVQHYFGEETLPAWVLMVRATRGSPGGEGQDTFVYMPSSSNHRPYRRFGDWVYLRGWGGL